MFPSLLLFCRTFSSENLSNSEDFFKKKKKTLPTSKYMQPSTTSSSSSQMLLQLPPPPFAKHGGEKSRQLRTLPRLCEDNTCPHPFADGTCICDLRAFAKCHSDWPIAMIVGVRTYAQLCDAAPGLFEPFPDVSRSDREHTATTVSLVFLNGGNQVEADDIVQRIVHSRPGPPPNDISGMLSSFDGTLTMPDVKRLLIRATWDPQNADARIAPLLLSSIGYKNPQSSLAELFATTAILSFFASVLVGFVMRSLR